MKKCETCRFRDENEYHKPCIVYRDDCELYEEKETMMKVENIGMMEVDFEGPTYIGFCPKCGKMLRKARWGTDDECCGVYLEWDIENMDKRSLKDQQDDFWKEMYFAWEEEE